MSRNLERYPCNRLTSLATIFFLCFLWFEAAEVGADPCLVVGLLGGVLSQMEEAKMYPANDNCRESLDDSNSWGKWIVLRKLHDHD